MFIEGENAGGGSTPNDGGPTSPQPPCSDGEVGFVDNSGGCYGNGGGDAEAALIDYLNQELGEGNWSEELLDEFLFLIEEFPDASLEEILSLALIDSPVDPINNIEDMLNCFNINQQAVITIYAQQPNPNNPNIDRVGKSVGHSFITIQQNGKSLSFGFYPESGYGFPVSTQGIFGNNENTNFTVSITKPIQGNQLNAIKNLSISYQSSQYNLESHNCTNFAIEAAILAGFSLDVNSCIGSWGIGNGRTPGKFGEQLRNTALPYGATRNLNGGTSINNNLCN